MSLSGDVRKALEGAGRLDSDGPLVPFRHPQGLSSRGVRLLASLPALELPPRRALIGSSACAILENLRKGGVSERMVGGMGLGCPIRGSETAHPTPPGLLGLGQPL